MSNTIKPTTAVARDVLRQVIIGALKWSSLTQPLAVSVHESPDEQGHYSIAATPWQWAMHNDGPEPWICGEAWVENRNGRAVVVWRMPQQRYVSRDRGADTEQLLGPRFEWDYTPDA